MAEEVGAAYVSLIPSARGFGKLAEREVRRELRGKGISVPITPEVDKNAVTAAFTGTGGTIRVPVTAEVDRQQVTAAFASVTQTERVTVRTEVDTETARSTLRRNLGSDEGVRTGRDYGDGWSRGANEGIDRTRERVVTESGRTGRDSGRSMSDGIRGGLIDLLPSSVSSAFGTIANNPIISSAAALIGLAVAIPLAGAIGAGLAAAMIGGAGLGVIGLGAWILREEPAVVKAASSLGDRLKATLGEAAKPLIAPFVESLGMLEQLLIDIGPDLRSMFETIAPAVRPLTEGLIGFIKGAMPGFLDLVEAAVPLLTDLASTLPRLGEDFGQVFSVIADAGPGASMFLRDVLNVAGLLVMAVADWISWLSQLYALTSSILHGVVEVLRQAVLGWGYMIDAVVEKFKHLAKAIVGVYRGIRADSDSIVSFFKGIPNRIWAALGNTSNLLRQAGRNIIQGLINGIRSMFAPLGNAIGSATQMIRNYLPFSPAKTGPLSGSGNPFASGQTIATMLAGGMTSKLPAVSSASSQLAGAVGFGASRPGSTAAAAAEMYWREGATGDQVLDALRELIGARFGGDPDRALATG